MKIIHIISSLDFGGAEKVLFNICNGDKENEHIIIYLTRTFAQKALFAKIISHSAT